MNEHRYILDRSSKKHNCPNCGKVRFVKYIDTETGEHLPGQYGRCDREVNCSYHLNPYTDGYAKMIREPERGDYSGNLKPQPKQHQPKPKPERVFIPVDVFKQTLQGYEQNIFLQNLLSHVPFPFETKYVEKVVSLYYLGTVSNGYRTGAITFPFIDKNENVRAIQVKQFDQTNHTTGTDFLHSIIEKHHTQKNKPLPNWLEAYNKNETKVSCLFGEHLLSKYPFNPVALVEAPKTAIYGTLYFGFPEHPENLLWLAVYNLSSLNFNKCQALQGRDIYLFPDLSKDGKAFELWSNKAKELGNHLPGTKFIVSDLLEQKATKTEHLGGLDLADYLIKQDWRKFKPQRIEKVQEIEQPQTEPIPEPLLTPKSEKGEKGEAQKTNFFPHSDPLHPVELFETGKDKQSENWEKDINELETFFTGIQLPTEHIKLNPCSMITDISKFIEGHLPIVKANNGKETFKPYLDRLHELKQYLTINLN